MENGLSFANNAEDKYFCFDYEKTLPPEEIRILELLPGDQDDPLHCEILQCRLSDRPWFEALSYCWGPLENCEAIRWRGLEIRGHITRNLTAALRALRLRKSSRYLWVDAVCINQLNDSEKAHHVRIMDKIYKSASNVLVWLGEDDVGCEFGMEALQYFASPVVAPTEAPWYSFDPSEYAWGLKEILSRPWWTRMWTIQEAALARSLTFVCGPHKVSWTADIRTIMYMKFKIKFAATSPQWEEGPLCKVDLGPILQVVETQLREVAESLDIKVTKDLLDVVYDFRERQATDPRDKVYAIINLAEGRKISAGMVVDYSETREEARERLARAVLDLYSVLNIQNGI